MLKLNELSNPDSCLSRALPYERVFVLLARDVAAPATITFWCERRVAAGKNTWQDPQIVEAMECARLMEEERDEIRKAERTHTNG
jgi:hypothetical protein